jgi:hypothetical protein
MNAPYEPLRRLRPIGYTLALLLFVLPVGEIIATAFPFHWGQAIWRYSLEGMAAASSATMLVGAFLMLAFAAFTGHRGAAWFVAILGICAALVYLALVPFAALDAIQLKANIPATEPGKFKLTAGWIMLKLAVSGLAFLLITLAAFRSLKSPARSGPRTANNPAPIVTGR